MNDENPGVGQGALPPRETTPVSRTVAERPAMRLTHVVGGQYVLTTPPNGTQALAQLNPVSVNQNSASHQQGAVTRIISISPSRSNQTSPLRPSLANQSIVNVLTKSRVNTNLHLQLYQTTDSNSAAAASAPHTPMKSPVKRPSTSVGGPVDKKDRIDAKLQHVMNYRVVRSKLLKEKYMEHLLEMYFIESGANLLDFPHFMKRPKSASCLAFLKEHSLELKESAEIPPAVSAHQTLPSTPSATPASSLPGISQTSTHTSISQALTTSSESTVSVKSSSLVKIKTPGQGNQEQIVEKAKQEAYVVQRINDLQKEGLWSEKRLPKLQEMQRFKTHWDYLLEEMVWLAADFAQERKWKKAAAKKCAKMVQKYFQDKALAAQKAEKAHEQNLRRIAAFCAREVKTFWANVEKLVEYKQHTILEEKRKKALDQQLSFIVDQTEKYSQLLAEGMNKTTDAVPSNLSSASVSHNNSDDEFYPGNQESTDDEETIEQEEANLDKKTRDEEVAALQKESEMDLDDFLKELPADYLQNRDKIKISDEESSDVESEKNTSKLDKDFEVDSNSEDDEATIEEEEKQQNSDIEKEHEKELEDLQAENEMSIDELRKKYSNIPDVPIEDEKSETSESSSDSEEESITNESDSEEISIIEKEDTSTTNLKMLIDDSQRDLKTDEKDDLINDAAAIAESIQPKGNTLSSTTVSTVVPFLLKYPLREYQHIGLDWLVTMCDRRLNGILADEMGLGKTIQTIALLAHLACEKENWGPHLIVVPTSVMLNWEMECKKWCPAFKILTYYGTQKERKLKRTGWTKANAFHICITSYKLVIQDHQSFRRKKWKYLILDEAQNIKNFKSQRWQLLLNFQTQQRLLLTGTPLQNNLMELWSLMHFLMPNVFQSHREFKEWFSNPVTGMIEGNNEYNETIIKRLHKVLRPFLLRRLKSEVEKQMPKKYEHVVVCRLSKRQRYLYDDYMSRAKTKETLATGNLLSVINVLMQLRKVCNHPNLFEVRPTVSPFYLEQIVMHIPSLIFAALDYDVWKHVSLEYLNLSFLMMELQGASAYQYYRCKKLRVPFRMIQQYQVPEDVPPCPPSHLVMRVRNKCKEIKLEKKEIKAQIQSNLKLKVDSHGGVQLVQQQGSIVKAIPVNIAPGAAANIAPGSNSLLKIDNKLPAGLSAQLVQTPQGKRLLFTTTATGNLPVTANAQGQKMLPLTKNHVTGNNTQPIAKAFVNAFPIHKLGSVNSNAITVTNTPNDTGADNTKVGTKFLNQLYSKQISLDVRWDNGSKDNEDRKEIDLQNRLNLMAKINDQRCSWTPLYGIELREAVKIDQPLRNSNWVNGSLQCAQSLKGKSEIISEFFKEVISTPEKKISQLSGILERFVFYVPPANTKLPELQIWHPKINPYKKLHDTPLKLAKVFSKPAGLLHNLATAMVTQFPDPRLIQYDCGKLQTLDRLLRKLKVGNHRVLIFTQMTKMLDVLEAFLNFHGHIYLRLDGTTKVDQRQVLMERFNGDPRIFAFILSTRSGGVGVNLTGADTVIFYDSDWNPTMDAQAQDRCHRIGQTRDVHIYRLVSERTIEENILKKANQKRLLGDLAIEGGNFTTAYFKSTTIQDLFNIDSSRDAAQRMSNVDPGGASNDSKFEPETSQSLEEKNAVGVLENALASCEDDQDVQAARTAKAEAVADLAEFDENIPLDDTVRDKEPEMSRAEQEIENVIKQLTPVERYAMKFIEETESAWSAEQLAAAERLIEEQKLEWEQNRLAAMKEEEERRAKELQEENELLTYSREDAENQMWVSENTMEQMPMWCPPTPPQQDTDVFIDSTMSFLYDINVMSESQLPPVYVKKELKRTHTEAGLVETRRSLKIPRKEELPSTAPRSLFYQHALFKIRRDAKWQKYRGSMRSSAISIPGKPTPNKLVTEQPLWHDWTIHEDMALLKVIQNFQGLPLNLLIVSPGHVPNWDFVADYVNTVSITYRSPKQCRQRYENSLIQREEGKQLFYESNLRKKKNKSGGSAVGPSQKFVYHQKSNRPMRTAQLYTQDNNSSFSQIMVQRYEALKNVSSKYTISQSNSNTRQSLTGGASTLLQKNPKHTAVLNECGIDFDRPMLPVEVANRRQERLAREKKMTPEARLQIMKGLVGQSIGVTTATTASSSTAPTTQSTNISQVQAATVGTSNVTTAPSTPPKLLVISETLRGQRIITSPLQSSNVVSVSSLSPAQLQAAQRLIVSASSPSSNKTVVTQQVQSKTLSPAQLQIIRQAASFKQQLRVQGQIGGVKTTTVTIGGQPAVVQFTQAQPSPRAQFVRQAGTTVQVGGKAAITRTVTESEVAQILKKQQQLQQQKALAAAAAANQPTSIQNISSQLLAQSFQQAGSSGTSVATLVKTVSSSGGGSQTTVTIPVTGVAIATGGKGLQSTLKTTTPQQLRQLQIQQQLLAQKKLGAAAGTQKLSLGQVAAAAGKGNVQTQLIVGSKPLTTAMTVQQLQQVIRSPLGVSQGPVVLAKGTPRVIPVNAGLGTKQTIQVVTATSQGLGTAFRPQSSSTLAGALTGVKVQTSAQAQQALLSQVSVALQNQGIGVRQGSPVRIQTANGTPLVAVTVQSSSSTANTTAQTTADTTTLRFTKK